MLVFPTIGAAACQHVPGRRGLPVACAFCSRVLPAAQALQLPGRRRLTDIRVCAHMIMQLYAGSWSPLAPSEDFGSLVRLLRVDVAKWGRRPTRQRVVPAKPLELGKAARSAHHALCGCADGVPPVLQPRGVPPGIEGLLSVAPAAGGYRYVILHLWLITITRRSVALAASAASLTFVALQVRAAM